MVLLGAVAREKCVPHVHKPTSCVDVPVPLPVPAGLRRSRRCEQAVGWEEGDKDDAECAICHLYMHLSAGKEQAPCWLLLWLLWLLWLSAASWCPPYLTA